MVFNYHSYMQWEDVEFFREKNLNVIDGFNLKNNSDFTP